MGTRLSRRDFLCLYPGIAQGLFIFMNPRRMPKDQPVIDIGRALSDKLCDTPAAQRGIMTAPLLQAILAPHAAATLTNYELLFTPSLRQDVIGTLLSAGRNRKLCIAWAGRVNGNRLLYADENSPEHYEREYTRYVDTYLITD